MNHTDENRKQAQELYSIVIGSYKSICLPKQSWTLRTKTAYSYLVLSQSSKTHMHLSFKSEIRLCHSRLQNYSEIHVNYLLWQSNKQDNLCFIFFDSLHFIQNIQLNGVEGIKQHILGQISLIVLIFSNRVVHVNKGLEFHQCLASTTKYIKPSVFLYLFRTKFQSWNLPLMSNNCKAPITMLRFGVSSLFHDLMVAYIDIHCFVIDSVVSLEFPKVTSVLLAIIPIKIITPWKI